MGKEFQGVDEALADMFDSLDQSLASRKIGGSFNSASAVKAEYAAFAKVDISNLPAFGSKK